MDSLASVLSQYSYIFFVCEGTNEEILLDWIINENHSVIMPQYTLEYMRKCRTKKGREQLKEILLEYDYDAGTPVIVYLCDSRSEKWQLGYDVMHKKINVIKVITHPEIEILLILSNRTAEQQWAQEHRKNKSLKPSAFCKKFFHCNIKNGYNMQNLFGNFDIFADACKKYKAMHNDHYCLSDMLR